MVYSFKIDGKEIFSINHKIKKYRTRIFTDFQPLIYADESVYFYFIAVYFLVQFA